MNIAGPSTSEIPRRSFVNNNENKAIKEEMCDDNYEDMSDEDANDTAPKEDKANNVKVLEDEEPWKGPTNILQHYLDDRKQDKVVQTDFVHTTVNRNKALDRVCLEVNAHQVYMDTVMGEFPTSNELKYNGEKARSVCREQREEMYAAMWREKMRLLRVNDKRSSNNHKSLLSRYKQKMTRSSDSLSVLYLRERVEMVKERMLKTHKLYPEAMEKFHEIVAAQIQTKAVQTKLNDAKNKFTDVKNKFTAVKTKFEAVVINCDVPLPPTPPITPPMPITSTPNAVQTKKIHIKIERKDSKLFKHFVTACNDHSYVARSDDQLAEVKNGKLADPKKTSISLPKAYPIYSSKLDAFATFTTEYFDKGLTKNIPAIYYYDK